MTNWVDRQCQRLNNPFPNLPQLYGVSAVAAPASAAAPYDTNSNCSKLAHDTAYDLNEQDRSPKQHLDVSLALLAHLHQNGSES
jgi:hypothetical protein